MDQTDKERTGMVVPRCPYFGECGGCIYQDVSYDRELGMKQSQLRLILTEALPGWKGRVETVVASPREYHYRHRLDLRLLKTKDQKIFVGFSPRERFGVVDVDQCVIALEAVSEFIPELKRQAAERLPQKYRLANLVVRCGDDAKVHWGGIGKRSLQQDEADYFWTEVNGLKVYYALDTFFQANLSILPHLMTTIKQLPVWSPEVTFLDLYGGVGLFSLGLAGAYGQALLIEDSKNSLQLAHYNVRKHDLSNVKVIEGRVEEQLQTALAELGGPVVAMIDPPRAGLSSTARETLAKEGRIDNLLYLSCNPEALGRDLHFLSTSGWEISKVMPFDFFPKTRHLETLVWLTAPKKG